MPETSVPIHDTAAALRRALRAAHHELTILHGLCVCDGAAPGETWTVDTRRVVELIEKALGAARD